MNRRQARLIPILLAVVALLAFPLNAGATTYNISGTVYRQQEVNYTTVRYVQAGGSNIHHQKTDGPGLWMKWRKCSDWSVSLQYVYFSDPDPTATLMLDYGFRQGADICLSVISNGANYQDTFSGILYMDVYW